jgi:hypothetical protein
MIDINTNNYEECIVDFFDGNLNSSEEKALMVFLDKNPELKEEFNFFDNESLLEEEFVFNDKESLKKSLIIHKSMNFQELCIASIEGDLSVKEHKLFKELLFSDSAKLNEYKKFENTKLSPDLRIIYPKKEILRRKSGFVWKRSYYAISIAASILLLVGLFVLSPQLDEDTERMVSQKTITEKVDTIHKQKIKRLENPNQLIAQSNLESSSKNTLSEVSLASEVQVVDEEIKEERGYKQIAYLTRKEYSIKSSHSNSEMVFAQVTINVKSIRSILANNVNRKERSRESKKIELFDIAKASVEGINWLTGGHMTLERGYNEKGEVNKTEFTSSLIAFSAPVKN